MLVDWDKFSKQELVSILRQLEEEAWVVEKLDGDAPTLLLKTCSCDAVESPAPLQIQETCLQAATRANRPSPLQRLLRRPSTSSAKQHRRQA